MVLKLPELTDLNTYIQHERSNRFKGAKTKRENTMLVMSHVLNQLKGVKLDKINKITFIWKHKNKRKDPDNVSFASKFIFDGMVAAGLIPDDSWKYLPTRFLHKHEVNKDDPGVVVLIK